MNHSSRIALAAALFATLARVTTGVAAGDSAPHLRPASAVRTVAGSGAAGVADGVPAGAEFLAPSGLAIARDGTTYVADAAAQRVRVVAPDGRVSTLAGGGAVDASGLSVTGGFRDGARDAARFNRPLGVALDAAGAVYVADELNHCIRRISGGVVSTYAGNPSAAGKADGPLGGASFTYPRALSFDRDGDLFVADYGVGVREISRAGIVTTLPLPGIGATVTGVSAFGSGATLAVFIANLDGLAVYRPAKDAMRFYNGAEGDRPFGHPYGVFALSGREALVTDAREHAVRYFRAPNEPTVTTTFSRVVAGSTAMDGSDAAGFRDGDPAAARFDLPLGVAVGPARDVFVADAGNRRVRAFPMFDTRGPVSDVGDFDAPGKAYRIVYVSNSYAFWDSMWTDSTAGILEDELRASAAEIGLKKKPRVYVARIDGTSVAATHQYVSEVLSQGVADLVVFEVNLAHVYADIGTDHSLEVGHVWARGVARHLREARAALRSAGADLVVVVGPTPSDASPLEAFGTREVANPQNVTYDQYVTVVGFLEEAVRASGVPALDLVPQTFAEEARPGHTPLYETYGLHFSRAGRAFVAHAIARYLITAKPWSR